MNKQLKNYHLVNNIIGWVIGIIACAVYIMTAEATASWWDCGEYIATAYKVQVGHPPGAPTFQILGRLFSLFSNPYHAAYAVNVLSAICSGLGIMFLYWTITLLGKKLLKSEEISLSNSKVWAVFASGVVGALVYTFSDTYWFSAVEGEVYAMSSFFTAVVFWAILKWDEQADDRTSLRWLILICFLVGMAIGVHLLNLLTIPAIVYVVYFKKYKKTTVRGLILSGVISLVILAAVLWGVIPGIVNLSCDFDVFFVNSLHTGFNSGTVVFFLFVALFVLWGLWNNSRMKRAPKFVNILFPVVMFLLLFIAKIGAGTFSFGFFVVMLMLGAAVAFILLGKKKPIVNSALLGLLMLVIGYSTFFILVIRANTNTPLNENAPKDAVAMRAYLGREQYGQTPLFSGPYYTAGNPERSENDYAKYIRTKDEDGRDYYKLASYAQKYIYNSNHTGLFPRMYSNDGSRQHPTYYKYWAGDPPQGSKPTFAQNLKFFHRYQMGWMYWRYFMWNFSGRQNDIQGHHFDDNVMSNQYGDDVHVPSINYIDGNWISGIKFVDNRRLGPQDNLPDDLANNKARNKYYMLPLLLGLLGLIFQCVKKGKDAFVVFLMFFMTGLAIAIYLNMPPRQPRERDYAFVGSFYFFSVWVGLGVYALFDWFSSKLSKPNKLGFLIAGAVCILLGVLFGGAAFVLSMVGVVLILASFIRIPKVVALPLAFLLSMAVPIIMAAENWDDHDRSQKTAARDFAKNYLGSIDKNGVLITFGDNDTFPLWYIQEVEGHRTDVRILNYTLSGMHWYVEQLYNKVYESEPLPFTLPKDMYGLGHEIYILNPDGPEMEVKEALSLVANNRSRYVRYDSRSSDSIVYLPTNKFKITLDKQKLIANGIIDAAQADTIPDAVRFSVNISRGYMIRNEMMMLDILGTNAFERPISIMNPDYIRNVFPLVDRYSINDGMVYLIVPYPVYSRSQMNFTKRSKDYFINGMPDADGKLQPLLWGNLEKDIYVDPISKNMGDVQRLSFTFLAHQCLAEGDTVAAGKLVDIRDNYFPVKNFPHDRLAVTMLYLAAEMGDQVKAYSLLCDIFEYYDSHLKYVQGLNGISGSMSLQGFANTNKQANEACYILKQVCLMRLRSPQLASPFTGTSYVPLTEEGEKAFVNVDSRNAARLKAIDDFMKSDIYTQYIAPAIR